MHTRQLKIKHVQNINNTKVVLFTYSTALKERKVGKMYLFHVYRGRCFLNSEVCHPCCVFKLYGEVNSVKNTTINKWLNECVYWQWKKEKDKEMSD